MSAADNMRARSKTGYVTNLKIKNGIGIV